MRLGPIPVRSRRARPAPATLLAALVVLAAALQLVLALPGSATSGTPGTAVDRVPQRYYLALGDSIAYGMQPHNAGASPATVDTGYVDVLAAHLRKLSPGIRVVNYGCPGESTVTFVLGRCPWVAEGRKLHDAYSGPQLAAAVAFLRAHPGEVSPITLTLWGNDVVPLSEQGKRAPREIAAVAGRLGSILRRLRAEAPRAEIIVTGAWNPEADRLARAAPLYRSLHRAIVRVAGRSGARVADAPAVFNGRGTIRAQRARLCRLTHVCSGDPHPTDAGYRALAAAFLAASGYSDRP